MTYIGMTISTGIQWHDIAVLTQAEFDYWILTVKMTGDRIWCLPWHEYDLVLYKLTKRGN